MIISAPDDFRLTTENCIVVYRAQEKFLICRKNESATA